MSKRRAASLCSEGLGVPLAVGEVGRVEQPGAQALDPPVQAARA